MPHREYFKIPPSDFAVESVLKVDIYYQVSPARFQKMGLKGTPFCESHIPAPLKKGLHWLFLKKQDYETYVGLNLGQSAPTLLSTGELEKKIEHVQQNAGNLIRYFTQKGLKSPHIETATNTLYQTLRLIFQNSVTLKLFESLHAIEMESFHSLAVGFWSLLIARRMGYTGEPYFFQIALCALFHDVGFRENLTPILDKKSVDLTSQENKILESHAFRGRDILNSIPGLPSEVALVALQHHETAVGTGYPSQLRLEEIHPFARLIALTNRFCELEWLHRPQNFSFQDTFSILQKDQIDFDPKYFIALKELIEARS